MADNEVDEITREMRTLGQAATVAIGAWRRQNPGKTKVPRKVRKEAMRELREAMRAHELLLASERRFQRAAVEQMITNHRALSLDLHRSAPGTPEQYARVQWAHAQQRHNLAEQIHSAGHLTREERGQAVMALVSAHYADNPNVRQRPVWGPRPYGMTALRARLAERVSRVQEGLEQRRENRSARKAPQRPAAPSVTGLHQYWSNPMPPQDQAANARIAALEQQLRNLAAERDLERDQLQVKLTQLGEKVLDARQQHKSVADQLAQRGQELTDAHTELAQVRGERDAAVRKLVENTPARQRYGSPERQAQQARPTAQTPKSPDASKQAPEAPRPEAGGTRIEGRSVVADNIGGTGNTGRVGGRAPATSDARPTAPAVGAQAVAASNGAGSVHVTGNSRVMAGNVGGNGNHVNATIPPREHPETPAQPPKASEVPGVPAEPAQAPDMPSTAPERDLGEMVTEQDKRLAALDATMRRLGVPEETRSGVLRTFETPQETREMVGVNAAGRAAATTTHRINGSRKVTGPGAPEIPLPPEPPTGLEPPEFTR